MPSPKKLDHTTILAQTPDDIHAQADSRRRREGVTWARLITTLLQRYAAGADDQGISAPVRVRAARPSAEQDHEFRKAAELAAKANPGASTSWVDPASITWHRSLSGLLAAEAASTGKSVPAGALDGLIDDDQEAAP